MSSKQPVRLCYNSNSADPLQFFVEAVLSGREEEAIAFAARWGRIERTLDLGSADEALHSYVADVETAMEEVGGTPLDLVRYFEELISQVDRGAIESSPDNNETTVRRDEALKRGLLVVSALSKLHEDGSPLTAYSKDGVTQTLAWLAVRAHLLHVVQFPAEHAAVLLADILAQRQVDDARGGRLRRDAGAGGATDAAAQPALTAAFSAAARNGTAAR